MVALLVGGGASHPAFAADGLDTDQAVQRARQHVQALKQGRWDPPVPATPRRVSATATRKVASGVQLAAFTPAEMAADPEAEVADPMVVDVPIEVETIEADSLPSPGSTPPASPTAAEAPAAATDQPAAAVEVAVPSHAAQPEPEALAPQPVQAAAPQPVQPAAAQAEQKTASSAQVPPQPDTPGVLTRQGTLVVEPGIEYSHTDVNQFSFGGVAILDTVLVGAIEAKQANRDAITGTLGLRYGITNRFEGELRIPYMYRADSSTNTFVNSTNVPQSTSISSNGLGDIEGALHYQFNDGTGKWPVFVGNLRGKSDTGTSPYDVRRNNLGIEEELATGSGFWGVEPSLTVIAPSDPAVFYANVGYLWNMKSDINKQIGNRFVDKVDPGDAVRMGVGMGLALNEKVSFSIGYQHDWIMKTKTTFADGDVKSPSLSVGSMTFGVNWQMSDTTALNVSVAVGVTSDAPDVRLMARVPIAIDLF